MQSIQGRQQIGNRRHASGSLSAFVLRPRIASLLAGNPAIKPAAMAWCSEHAHKRGKNGQDIIRGLSPTAKGG